MVSAEIYFSSNRFWRRYISLQTIKRWCWYGRILQISSFITGVPLLNIPIFLDDKGRWLFIKGSVQDKNSPVFFTLPHRNGTILDVLLSGRLMGEFKMSDKSWGHQPATLGLSPEEILRGLAHNLGCQQKEHPLSYYLYWLTVNKKGLLFLPLQYRRLSSCC